MRKLSDRYNELKRLNRRYVEEQESDRAVICHGLPVHFTVETTNRCNLRCPHCQIHSPLYEYMYFPKNLDLDFAVFEKLAAEVFPYTEQVCLTVSGEPLMSRHLEDVFDVLAEYGVGLEINTNGTLFNEKNIRRMLGVLRFVTVSMDGYTRGMFEKWRAGADFEQVLENVRTFNRLRFALPREERPHLNLTYVLMRDNIDEFPKFIELAHELRADSVAGSHVIVFDEHQKHLSLIYDKARCNARLTEAAEKAARLGVTLYLPPLFAVDERSATASPKPLRDSSDPAICSFLWRRSYLEINGDITTCCVPGRPVVESLRHKSFWEIWNSPIYRYMRASLGREGSLECCETCNFDPANVRSGREEAMIRREDPSKRQEDVHATAFHRANNFFSENLLTYLH